MSKAENRTGRTFAAIGHRGSEARSQDQGSADGNAACSTDRLPDGPRGIRGAAKGYGGERQPTSRLRVVLYARYSSDQQNPTSIEDQFRICRHYAARQDWDVVATYADAAKSGTSMILRPELLRMLEDAKHSKFDVVLAEAMDRLSRDQADMATISKRLRFHEITLITLEEGVVTRMHIGMKGTMNEQFIETLGNKVHRGIEGRVLEGTVVQLPYGYNIVRRFENDGITVIKGKREINPVQAEIVRRIFREYAAGISPLEIARRLNEEGIPGPKGGRWSSSSVRGHPKNGTGIINNPLYIGKLVWNRARKIRNPETGKEIARLNPPAEWIITDVPHLRIVDDDLWNAVRARQADLQETYSKIIASVRAYHRANPGLWLSATHRPQTPLSGLIYCQLCDSRYNKRGQDYFGCSKHIRSKGCSNSRSVHRRVLESCVVDGVRELLADSEVVSEAMRTYLAAMERLSRERTGSRASKVKLLEQVQGKVKEITRAIEDGGYSRALGERLRELEARRDELEAHLVPVAVPEALPPIEEFLRRVENLVETLRDPDISQEAWGLIRGLIDRIVVLPDPNKRGKFSMTLHGDLAAVLTQASASPTGLQFQRTYNVEVPRKKTVSRKPRIGRPLTKETRERIARARKGQPAWNKGISNPLSAENGRKGAEKLRSKATGRKRCYRPDGSWTWTYPEVHV
jgi:DNA invertase Pin-like site-specific DNA recombinase